VSQCINDTLQHIGLLVHRALLIEQPPAGVQFTVGDVVQQTNFRFLFIGLILSIDMKEAVGNVVDGLIRTMNRNITFAHDSFLLSFFCDLSGAADGVELLLQQLCLLTGRSTGTHLRTNKRVVVVLVLLREEWLSALIYTHHIRARAVVTGVIHL
jgi:hypothetical protein